MLAKKVERVKRAAGARSCALEVRADGQKLAWLSGMDPTSLGVSIVRP